MLAACLMSWAKGEEDTDAQAGAFVVARFLNAMLMHVGAKD